MSESFGQRLRGALGAHGPLCVGIDPHPALLEQWGLGQDATGAREFGRRVVEAAAGLVAAVKPQVSFYERFGSAGFLALEDVLASARAAGLLVIADAKRGDIGTTMDAYAAAWFSPGSPLECDALTVNPYLGVGALDGTFDLAARLGKGTFVLAATSNPEAAAVQHALDAEGRTVSAGVIDAVSRRNAVDTAVGEWGSNGFVVGATIDWPEAGIAAFAPPAPILAPGFGAQGATPEDLRRRFGTLAGNVLASESRSILSAGPDRIRATIDERAARYREVMHG